MELQAVCWGGSFAVELVAAFAWNGWQTSSGISGNLGLEYAMKALDARISAERARESRLNRLRSSIGRKYCSNGELSYVTRICSRNVGCIDRDVTEPGQLHAYLEGVSEDGLRIQLRVHNWATDAGRLRAGAVSDITFSSRQSLGNPSYGFSLGPAFTQRAQPGLVFWSDAASWSQCSR
ncbi:hypothetical protein, partial [Marinobacter shengliensis]|uniref:hypothetical protein n=1 Tax=Marinobacter shengliensis TaxID=1389223 RepID=UPI001E2AB432